MSNPESRKISYFLALNLSFMGVQILYGIWTNSLGLISDGKLDSRLLLQPQKIPTPISIAIHMFFDCMAIGVGLVASIMARWPPNERFTYGWAFCTILLTPN